MRHRKVSLALLVALAAVVASCGGKSDQVSHAQRTPTGTVAAGTTDQTANAPRPPAKNNGIEAFGRPASPSDRNAVSAALRGYTSALAADDGAAACGYLAAPVRAQALTLLSSKSGGKRKSCAQLLAAMFAHQGPPMRAALRGTTITQVRVSGSRAFALFRQPGMPAGFYPLQREHGQWKVASIGASVLPVSPGRQ